MDLGIARHAIDVPFVEIDDGTRFAQRLMGRIGIGEKTIENRSTQMPKAAPVPVEADGIAVLIGTPNLVRVGKFGLGESWPLPATSRLRPATTIRDMSSSPPPKKPRRPKPAAAARPATAPPSISIAGSGGSSPSSPTSSRTARATFYQRKFGVNVTEWRIMSLLAMEPGIPGLAHLPRDRLQQGAGLGEAGAACRSAAWSRSGPRRTTAAATRSR